MTTASYGRRPPRSAGRGGRSRGSSIERSYPVPRRGGPTGPLGDGMAGVDTATEERPLIARESTRVRQQVSDGDRHDRRVGNRPRRPAVPRASPTGRSSSIRARPRRAAAHPGHSAQKQRARAQMRSARPDGRPRRAAGYSCRRRARGQHVSWRPAGCCDEQRPMTPRRQRRAARRRLSPPGGTPASQRVWAAHCDSRTGQSRAKRRKPARTVPESLAVEVGEFDVLRHAGVDPLDERGHVDLGLGFGQTVGAAGLDADGLVRPDAMPCSPCHRIA